MPGTDVATVAAADPSSNLAVWAQGAREVYALAQEIAGSALVPASYRGKPMDVLACWLTGQEIGLPPMSSLRSIDVIKGTPSLRAHAMRALVLSHGHDVEVVEATQDHCSMRGRRKGSATWQPVEWTIDRARQMGLIGKVAEGRAYDPTKDQWVTQPGTMLIARATAEVCRLIAADVLFAVPYATEEVRDDEPHVEATATVDRPARPRAASIADIVTNSADAMRRSVEFGTDEPSAPAAAEAEPVDLGDAPLAITPEQSKELHDLARALGRNTKAKLGPLLREVTGRDDVPDTTHLTFDEADRVIARLEADAPRAENSEPAGDDGWPEVPPIGGGRA